MFFKKQKRIQELEIKNQELEQKIVQQRATIFRLNITMSQLETDSRGLQHLLNVILNKAGGEISILDHDLATMIGDPKPISKYHDMRNNCFVITNKGVE